jgi:hypothetical protein
VRAFAYLINNLKNITINLYIADKDGRIYSLSLGEGRGEAFTYAPNGVELSFCLHPFYKLMTPLASKQ